MLLKIRIPFKLEDHHKDINNLQISSSSSLCRTNNIGSHKSNKDTIGYTSTMAQVGLRILVDQISSQGYKNYPNNNVVFRSSQQIPKKRSSIDSCFLKTCNLCNKKLRLDKEVYMYRGDQGFCSKECRDRQILTDENKELEASTKKMVEAYRSSCNSRSSETRSILEDLIHSRQTFMNNQHQKNNRVVFIF